jgi:hypothetical protein
LVRIQRVVGLRDAGIDPGKRWERRIDADKIGIWSAAAHQKTGYTNNRDDAARPHSFAFGLPRLGFPGGGSSTLASLCGLGGVFTSRPMIRFAVAIPSSSRFLEATIV